MNQPCGIIFDLDGTLIDTLDDISASVNEVLATLGKGPLSRERIRSFVGEGLANLLQQVTGVEDADATAGLVNRYRPIYRRRMFDHTQVYPGLDVALNQLAAAGHPFAVLSNKTHEFVLPCVEQLLGRWNWVDVRGVQSGLPRKPDPRQALEIAATMQRNAADVVFVGDSAIDVQTAQKAGMCSIGATWGYRDREELAAAGATCIIDRAAQLPDAIALSRKSHSR